ncbi:hypothetical protein TIFTF001_013111 [Ficus carica]|uniref:Uncharacterized protein n=1 Tax=Ficus carica TaxID=3494 RepID=A0AA88A3R0_FICCA|nr:hypothetical protein TIFTF001_013111 [Ficus carica]
MASAMVEDTSFEDDQLSSMTTDDIVRASRLLDNEIRILKEELQRTNLELDSFKEKIKENQEKIKLNKQLPYLVGNIVEILEMNPEDEAEEDGANIDLDSQRKGKCVVLKTSTRQATFGYSDGMVMVMGMRMRMKVNCKMFLIDLANHYHSRPPFSPPSLTGTWMLDFDAQNSPSPELRHDEVVGRSQQVG